MAYFCWNCGNEQEFVVKVGVKVGRLDTCIHCRDTNLRFPHQDRTVPLEVVGPAVFSWMVQADNRIILGIPTRYIRPLVGVTIKTAPGQVRFERTKNEEARSVALTGLALGELKQLSRVPRIDSKLVFPGRDGRKSVYIRAAWTNALKEAEISL